MAGVVKYIGKVDDYAWMDSHTSRYSSLVTETPLVLGFIPVGVASPAKSCKMRSGMSVEKHEG